jgi:hypothetical protein
VQAGLVKTSFHFLVQKFQDLKLTHWAGANLLHSVFEYNRGTMVCEVTISVVTSAMTLFFVCMIVLAASSVRVTG